VVIKLLILLTFISCGNKKIPECKECKIYIGDSQKGALVREQDQEYIYANTEEFNNMIGMTDKGFTAFVDTYINGCKKWKTDKLNNKTLKMNLKQIKKLFKKK
jgi:hypothetical protein